jgi:2-C-methyl-D-erythritol 2,4-cyclodiphosphate synthase
MSGYRIGQGIDAHRLVPGRPLVVGGVSIPHDRGLEGHSDGDVLLHAITDALLGALGEGDLGRHFPSSDPSLRGIASIEILSQAVAISRQRSFRVVNLDTTVVAQEPRLAPHQSQMETAIADVLGIPAAAVNLKVTSTDRMGAIGRGEGMAAMAVVLLSSAAEES